MEVNLQALPMEIVQDVASNLQPSELCSLRLKSSSRSLKKLSGLPKSEHLAPHVQTLHFRANRKGHLGRGFQWSRDTTGGLKDPLAGASGALRDILRDKLTNCRSFRIENYDDNMMPKETSWLTPSDMIFIIDSIITNANITVKNFRIEDKDGNDPARLCTKRLLPSSTHGEEEKNKGRSMWVCLDSLILRLYLAVEQYDWALSLLKSSPHVRQLSLLLDSDNKDTFFPRLAALGPFRALEILSLDNFNVRGTMLSRHLLQHGSTLRDLKFCGITLERDEDGLNSWNTVFGSMIGKMHSMESVCVDFLFSTHDGTPRVHNILSLVAINRCPVVPGSQKPTYGGGPGIRADERVIASLDAPIQVHYQHMEGRRRAMGVRYQGRHMDHFLDILAQAGRNLA